MKSINPLWPLVSWIIFLAGCVACLVGAVYGNLLITVISALVLWVASREISIKKCRCPYCGSKKTSHHLCLKGSQLLCPDCHHLIFYQ